MLAIRNLSGFYNILDPAWETAVKKHWVDFNMSFVKHSPMLEDDFFNLLAVNRLCHGSNEEDNHSVILTISVLLFWLVCLADWVAVLPYGVGYNIVDLVTTISLRCLGFSFSSKPNLLVICR